MKLTTSFPTSACFISFSAILLLCSGCKIFIPAHKNSDARKGETVQIKLISLTDVSKYPDFEEQYEKAFGYKPGDANESKLLVAAPAIAAAAVGFVMDYVSKQLAEEAKKYEAQFGDTIYDDKFWSGKSIQTYYGLEVTRSVEGESNAYRLVCGIAPTSDKQLLLMKPLIFQTKKAKVKVIGNGLASYLAVYPLIFNKPGNEINSTIDFTITGYFKDTDQKMKTVPMGAFSFKFPSYNIAKASVLKWSVKQGEMNAIEIPHQSSGVLDTAPISFAMDSNGKPVPVDSASFGVFSITSTVTETDTSNAKENIEKIGKLVSDQKPKLQDLINPKSP
jgi:hypothetical protein